MAKYTHVRSLSKQITRKQQRRAKQRPRRLEARATARADAERAESERKERQRLQEIADQEKIEAERADSERKERQRLQEIADQEKIEAERADSERKERQRLQEIADQEKIEAERAESERKELQRLQQIADQERQNMGWIDEVERIENERKYHGRLHEIYEKLDAHPNSGSSDRHKRKDIVRHADRVDSHAHLDLLYDRIGTGDEGMANWMLDPRHEEHLSGKFVYIPNFVFPDMYTNGRDVEWIHRQVQHETVVGATFGIHPKKAMQVTHQQIESLSSMLHNARSKAIAVGEMGLDFSSLRNYNQRRRNENMSKQVETFTSKLRMAVKLDLPVVIHCRGDDKTPKDPIEDQCIQIMQQILPTYHHVHRHCFTRNMIQARKWIKAFPNCFFGFTPCIGYGEQHDEVVRLIGIDRILLETDAPYFSQVRTVDKNGQPTQISYPGQVTTVANSISRIIGITVEEVFERTKANTIKCYKL